MARYTENAIEIITDDGRGIPVAFGSPAIGLAVDGHFALITGRPNIVSVTGDTTRTTWYPRILAQDSKSYLPSWAADFIEAGCFQEISSLEFSIGNTSLFYKTCEDNGVYLTGCRIIHYEVTSEDGAVWNFDRQWSGKIGDQPFDELTYRVKCNDDSREIFKNLPIESVNSSTFLDAPPNSQDKMIPIAIGRVANSPLVAVSQPGEKVVLVRTELDGEFIEYAGCGLRDYNPTLLSVNLYTKGVSFSQNDSRLIDSLLSIISGGDEQSVRILSNLGTDASENTNVTIEEEFTGSFSGWASGTTTAAMWFGEVQKTFATLIASQKEISEFKENSYGRASITTFDSESKKYRDVSDITRSYSTSNIKSMGLPGVDVHSKALDIDGSATAYYKFRCQDIRFRTALGLTYSGPAGSQLNLFDEDQSTGYQVTDVVSAGLVQLDITIPRSVIDQDFSDLYLLVDAKFRMASGASVGNTFAYEMFAQDVYGQMSSQIGSQVVPLSAEALTTASTEKFSIHGSYYNSESNPSLFYTIKSDASLISFMDSLKKARAFPRIMIHMIFESVSAGYIADIQEIAIIGKRTVNVVNENIYSGLMGEVFGTTWGGRMTPSAPILTLPDAIEHLVRNYDISAPVWRAGQVVSVGKKIRSTSDNNHVFICTVAGVTHATTEPTWTTTVGATYTDGTATWRQFMEIPIDITSFNSLGSRRGTWFVGRTLTEKKKSIEYYKQLFQQGFLIGLIDRFGKLKCKAWLDEATPLVTFDNTNIVPGTLEYMESSPITLAYTEILVRYDYNPGADKFNKQISITKADQPVFPGPNELVVPGIDLGTFTIEYVYPVGGLYQYVVTTDVDHGLSTGDYVMLSENLDGYDFLPTAVSVVATDAFRFLSSQAPFALSSTSGILVHATSTALLWKTFVTGISNYAFARDELWGPLRAAFLVCKTINKNPAELGDCHWFIDPYATDPNGGRLWTDLDVGDDHPAANHAKHLCNWSAWPKKMPTFQVPNETAYSSLEGGDCVYFNDAKQTAGLPLLGWISRKTKVARDDENPEQWLFGLTLRPEARIDRLTLDENMSGGDTYDENLPATDELDEN